MTIEDFKKLKPEYDSADTMDIVDAMEDYAIQQQQASEIIRPIMPLWKTHTLRWLYYRTVDMSFPNKWGAGKRCSDCKKGVSIRLVFLMWEGKSVSYCPHCSKEYKSEPNTNLSYRLWKLSKLISSAFWWWMDTLHLIRTGSRYDMFGDEARYVKSWAADRTGQVRVIHKPRKWWEYIIIEKPFHNF